MLLFVASGSDCGLSPLARETQPLFKNLVPFYRFIPAGAGNSRNEALDCRNYAVYPRWRGELILFAAESLCRYGLSPLARGTLLINRQILNHERFIPAGAGNSRSGPHGSPTGAVYPRWRGELHPSSLIAGSRNGLSPLARGTL